MGYSVRRRRRAILEPVAATPEPATTSAIPTPKATSVPVPGVPVPAACTPAVAVDDFEDDVDDAGADDVVVLALLVEEPPVSLDVLIEDEAAELDDADEV